MIHKQNIYFVGIGGIGMSALARYFNQIGKNVAGYDRATNTLTKRLQSEGIGVSDFSEADSIPFPYRDPVETLVVYTPAIKSENPILSYFNDNDFTCIKRAEVLGLLSQELPTIAVAGTHGKTTVSTILAFLMHKSGEKINAFLGGISRDFGTNLLLDTEAKYMVTEADEYDKSFLKLHPKSAIITAIDPDHLDIYEDAADIKKNYAAFAKQIDSNGFLWTKANVKNELNLTNVQVYTYAIEGPADALAKNLRVENGKICFDMDLHGKEYQNITCGLPGRHNVENALAAIALLSTMGLDTQQLCDSLAHFNGVQRRFDVHINRPDFVYIDDYAHHPEEIKALLKACRQLYPGRKLTGIFQPHLFSRTKDFAEQFANELDLFDEVILLELYPAREEPIEGVNSRWLSSLMQKEDVHVCQHSQLLNVLKSKEVEVLLTIGAGDIDQHVHSLISHYE